MSQTRTVETPQMASTTPHEGVSEQDGAGESVIVGNPSGNLEMEPQAETNAAEDESHYPTGSKFYLIMLCIGLVLIVVGMDTSIVAVAVPSMTQEWHTIRDIGWYSTAFRLCMCSFQFMFGKIYKLFKFKLVFLASMAIFLVGSILSATAPSSMAFIIARAVSGFACAGIIAGCFTILIQILPLRKRPMYTGIINAIEGVSTIAAPLLGGFIVQKLDWRWCFWINVPSGAITLIVLAIFLQDVRPLQRTTWRQKLSELDLVGNLVLVPSLTSLFMALTWAGTRYPWNSPTIIALFCVSVILMAVFAIDQWVKQDTATLPPKILKNRSVLAGCVFSLCTNSAMNCFEYYLPTYLQAVREYNPARSGTLMLPFIIGFLASVMAGGIGTRIYGYYVPFMLAGSLTMPIFAGLMTTLTVDSTISKLIAYSGLLGFAGGIGFQAPQVAVQTSLSTSDGNMGLAVILFAQHFGPAVFIAAAQTIFTKRLSQNLHDLAPQLNVSRVENMGLTDIKSHVGAKNLHSVLVGFDLSMVQTWYLPLALTCVTILGSATMEWKSVKQKRS